ncbi:MAG: hypothetical protein VZR54_05080 [Ruminococcus sp.]|nr:hypothetical protein [Ruminococcus sp.]
MNVHHFFEKYNISINSIDSISEYLIEYEANNCIIIDTLPKKVSIENNYKFEQIEHHIYDKVYFEKILTILKKLWLYDNMFFYSELLYTKKTKSNIPFFKRKEYKFLLNSKEKEITTVGQLELLNKLNNNGIIDIAYFLNEFELLITPCWNCFLVYFNKNDYRDLVQELIELEGLFIRKIC